MVGFLLRGIGIADEPLSLSQYPRQWTTTAFSGLKRTKVPSGVWLELKVA